MNFWIKSIYTGKFKYGATADDFRRWLNYCILEKQNEQKS